MTDYESKTMTRKDLKAQIVEILYECHSMECYPAFGGMFCRDCICETDSHCREKMQAEALLKSGLIATPEIKKRVEVLELAYNMLVEKLIPGSDCVVPTPCSLDDCVECTRKYFLKAAKEIIDKKREVKEDKRFIKWEKKN